MKSWVSSTASSVGYYLGHPSLLPKWSLGALTTAYAFIKIPNIFYSNEVFASTTFTSTAWKNFDLIKSLITDRTQDCIITYNRDNSSINTAEFLFGMTFSNESDPCTDFRGATCPNSEWASFLNDTCSDEEQKKATLKIIGNLAFAFFSNLITEDAFLCAVSVVLWSLVARDGYNLYQQRNNRDFQRLEETVTDRPNSTEISNPKSQDKATKPNEIAV